ncbi:MAG: DoxX family protein [Burkholderiaceae bacterium]
MFNRLQNPLALIGRVMLALIFITSGFSKIGGFEGTAGYIASRGDQRRREARRLNPRPVSTRQTVHPQPGASTTCCRVTWKLRGCSARASPK